MNKSIADILGSIVLGYLTASLLEGDPNTIILASIFWLLASIHFRISSHKLTDKK